MELDIETIQPIIEELVVPIASAFAVFVLTVARIWIKAKKKGA